MLFVFVTIFLSLVSFANQSSLTSGGKELFWANSSVPIVIRTNTSDLASTSTFSVIQNSITEWNASSSAKINSVNSSVNELKFVSNFPYGRGVIGITEISYNTAGAIQKAVISLNDDYYFHAQPGLYPTGQVYLGDVVTHEFGHLFGLSHSEVLNSSMFYSSFSGQSTISLDDESGLRQKYDSSYGSIYGYMKGGNDVGVLGVHVQAISRKTGQTSGAISDEDGYFIIGGLDLNDTYYLYTSPVKNPNSLPGYFANVQDEFCPAAYVGSFFNACGTENSGKPQGITLTDIHKEVDVGKVTINCSLRSDTDYNLEKLKTAVIRNTSLARMNPNTTCSSNPDNSYVVKSAFNPVTIFDYETDQKNEKSFVGWFRKTNLNDWSLSDLLKVDLTTYENLLSSPKYLKISLISFPFGNQLEYEMTVKKNDIFMATASRSTSYSIINETFETDFSTIIPLSSDKLTNHFEISIRSKKLTSSCVAQTYPSSDIFTNDQHLPYLLITSIWESTSTGLRPVLDSGVNLSDNSSCLDAPFTYPVKKSSDADKKSAISAEQAVTAAGCGTIEPPSGGPGTSLPLLVSGFILALIASSLFKTRKKFLS